MSALTTEHYTLQASRTATIVEANGRSSLFLSAVSGALVALALVAQLDRLGDTFLLFAFAVLPALVMLGVMSYARLADLAVHDAYYARAIGRIRGFSFDVAGPDARRYWLLMAVESATPLTMPSTAVIGVVLAVAVLAALLADQERRWRRCEQRSPAMFAADGTPREAQVAAAGPSCHLA
jgi:hypothetical protein